MTTLISGACGLIGSELAHECVKRGQKVIAVDNLSGGDKKNLPEGVMFFCEDICNQHGMEWIFNAIKPDFVIHAAAMAAENLSHNCRSFTYSNNLVGSTNVINLCVKHRVKLMMNLSSIAVYGHGSGVFYEGDRITPSDPYGIAKLAVELDLRAAHEFFNDFNYITFRPHNVVGVRQNLSDASRNVLSIFIKQYLTMKPFTIFGDGSQTRSFTPVKSIVPIMVDSMTHPLSWNNEFNIGTDNKLSVLALAAMVNPYHPIEYLPGRKECVHAHCDHSKLHRFFGEPDEAPLAELIEEMTEAARTMDLNKVTPFPKIEIEEGMPEIWKQHIK